MKGAFTSAIASKKGLFEVADRGTIFLDEIGTMGLETQAKMLRVLQDRKFMHLGGIHEIQVDVRIIAATNVDLQELVREGKFREDLYYRLNVITVDLPPLRERSEDIPLLVGHFLEKFSRENGKSIMQHCAGSHAAADGLCLAGQRPRTGERNRTRRGAVLRADGGHRIAPGPHVGRGSEGQMLNTARTPPCSRSSRIASAASSSTCWKNAAGTRPTPPSASTSRFPR